ncbi:MAG: hypothetical protein AAF292_00215 [Pseudomonadota bacterium]
MTEKTAKAFERDWMTPWEKWALKQLFENGLVDMSTVPEGDAYRGGEDADKPAVVVPLIQPSEGDKDALPEPIPEADWPAWQILSPKFLEYVCTDKAFIDARRRNRVRIYCARFTDEIDLGGLHLPGELWLDKCGVDKRPDLHDAEIGGLLSLEASHIPQGLYAPGLKTKGDVFLSSGARFDSEVSLPSADIGGQLNCSGSSFKAGDGHHAFFAQGLKTRGDVYLRGNSSFEGEVSLTSAEIGGQLECDGSSFKAGDGKHALNAHSLKSGGNVFLRGGASFEGEVNLIGASIGGQLECDGSAFNTGDGQYTLLAQGLKTGGSVYLRSGASFEGKVSLTRAGIGGGLQLSECSFHNEVDLTSSIISHEIRLDESELSMPAPNWGDGAKLNLQNASVGALQGSLDAWKREDGLFVPRNLDGLTFKRLAGGVGGTSLDQASTKQLRRWLSENVTHAREGDKTAFTPSPYLAMASALTATGEDIKARNILIALEKRRTRAMRFRSLSGTQKLFRILWLGPVTGYGYASGRGAWLLLALILAFAAAGFGWDIADPRGGADGLTLEDAIAWLGFSFEMVLPLADLDPVTDTFLEDRFTDDGEYTSLPTGLRALFMTERFLGLAILATLIAGLTGWAERRGEN